MAEITETNVEFIESAADFVRDLANELYAAKNDEDKDVALERLNLVLNDIVRAAKGELPNEPGPTPQVLCCRQCASTFPNDPVGYRNCMYTCNRSC